MNNQSALVGIYDFKFFPYALGDVLTWNIRTAMKCQQVGKSKLDIYICLDKFYPASIYQQGMINSENYELFFNELHSAFCTHPCLGNIFIFRSRDELLLRLSELRNLDIHNEEAIIDYLNILNFSDKDRPHLKIWYDLEKKLRTSSFIKKIFKSYLPSSAKKAVISHMSYEAVLNRYFIKYIYSHEAINEFYAENGNLPILKPALGCLPDIEELLDSKLLGKKIVCFHLRLRQLDFGYGGEHTYLRDSDFVEWYRFLKLVGKKYPDIHFIALGRLQEKPLEILKLSNVTSLRLYGMGLGHELTMMYKANLFIGTSSGFAAFANFSNRPYFITKMNEGSCKAYDIPLGADRLPFSYPNQELIYENETTDLLLGLLEKGLSIDKELTNPREKSNEKHKSMNLKDWYQSHHHVFHPSRTTSRFYIDSDYAYHETIYLMIPYLTKIKTLILDDNIHESLCLCAEIRDLFPCEILKFPDYLLMELSCHALNDDLARIQPLIDKLSLISGDLIDMKFNPLHQDILERTQQIKSFWENHQFLRD